MITPMSRILPAAVTLAVAFSSLSFADSLPKESFGQFEGKDVYLFTLKNASGMTVKITNYGGTVQSISVKDRHGKFGDVVLGFNTLDEYVQKAGTAYFGALIGRYGNRIAHGIFKLDGKTYHIPTNDNGNALHGGKVGFNRRVWDAKDVSEPGKPALELHYRSPDGEEGFPGNLDVTVRYTLTEENALRIDYTAVTDKTTVVNFTNHSFFNLAGEGSGDVLHHIVTMNASR